jgi:hypothetical protein
MGPQKPYLPGWQRLGKEVGDQDGRWGGLAYYIQKLPQDWADLAELPYHTALPALGVELPELLSTQNAVIRL